MVPALQKLSSRELCGKSSAKTCLAAVFLSVIYTRIHVSLHMKTISAHCRKLGK